MAKKILITGGAGYIGSHTALELIKFRHRGCGVRQSLQFIKRIFKKGRRAYRKAHYIL